MNQHKISFLVVITVSGFIIKQTPENTDEFGIYKNLFVHKITRQSICISNFAFY